MQIADLDRAIRIEQPTDKASLHKYSKQYTGILDRYENHTKVDYLRAKLEATKSDVMWSKIIHLVKTYLWYLIGFGHYPIVTLIELWFICKMVQPPLSP